MTTGELDWNGDGDEYRAARCRCSFDMRLEL